MLNRDSVRWARDDWRRCSAYRRRRGRSFRNDNGDEFSECLTNARLMAGSSRGKMGNNCRAGPHIVVVVVVVVVIAWLPCMINGCAKSAEYKVPARRFW